MKRFLSVFLALAMMVSMTTVAFAELDPKPTEGRYSGIASFDDGPMYLPGESLYLDVDYFYGKWRQKEWDKEEEKDVSTQVDVRDYPIVYLEKEYHAVSATWTSGGKYVENVYFEDGDDYVTIQLKGGVSLPKDTDLKGTVKIKETNYPNRPSVTYECKIEKGTVILEASDEKSRMEEWGDRKFSLPYDYQDRQVRFVTEDGEDYGTFLADFKSQKDGANVAQFQVRIDGQTPLFLGFSEVFNSALDKKYPDADLRILNWTARPTFDRQGTLSIYMDPDEYIYGINDDNTLYRLGGSYDSDKKAYVISTKTLGNYVISDVQLSAGGSGSSGSAQVTSPSSAPASGAPSSTAPPPASSTAPPPASSAPASSEDPSSAPEEPDEPEDDDGEDPDPGFTVTEPDDGDDDNGDDEKEPVEKKKFPLVPVVLGVVGVAVLIGAVVVVGNRSSGSRSRSRRRRYDDDWDD